MPLPICQWGPTRIDGDDHHHHHEEDHDHDDHDHDDEREEGGSRQVVEVVNFEITVA